MKSMERRINDVLYGASVAFDRLVLVAALSLAVFTVLVALDPLHLLYVNLWVSSVYANSYSLTIYTTLMGFYVLPALAVFAVGSYFAFPYRIAQRFKSRLADAKVLGLLEEDE